MQGHWLGAIVLALPCRTPKNMGSGHMVWLALTKLHASVGLGGRALVQCLCARQKKGGMFQFGLKGIGPAPLHPDLNQKPYKVPTQWCSDGTFPLDIGCTYLGFVS